MRSLSSLILLILNQTLKLFKTLSRIFASIFLILFFISLFLD